MTINEPETVIPVTSIDVTGVDGINTINTDNGSLQLIANILPSDATDKTITWTITNGSWLATIDETGLVTATGNGTITVRGTVNDGTAIFGERAKA